MSGGEVVCSGWLRKSPPEKKLKRYVSVPSPSRLSRSPRPARPPPRGSSRRARTVRPPPGSVPPPPSRPRFPFLLSFFIVIIIFLSGVSASLRSLFRENLEREGGGVFFPSSLWIRAPCRCILNVNTRRPPPPVRLGDRGCSRSGGMSLSAMGAAAGMPCAEPSPPPGAFALGSGAL